MVIDAGKRNNLRIFHVITFSILLVIMWLIALKPDTLTTVGQFVWVERGADFIVYLSIIGLWIAVFSLIQYSIKHQQELTRLTTAQALQEFKKNYIINQLPHHEKNQYLFLIRAYNEETVIGSVIDEIIQSEFHTIVICNDGSSDNTEDIIIKKQLQYPKSNIFILSHLINRWPGAANKTLFMFAKQYMLELWCQRAVSYDADGQMDITDMNTFIPKTQTNNYDIIFWSRFVKGGQTTNIPLMRRIILRGWRIVTYIFDGVWLTDVSTWYRLYNHHAMSNITIMSDWFSYQNDIINSVRRKSLRFTEIPVHIKYTDYSLSKWQSNMSAFKILVRLIYSSLFQR